MVNKKTCLMLLAILFLFTVPFASAVPPLPAAYFGNITVNGEPAPAGTTVIAKINGVEKGRITTTISGMYAEKPREESLVVQGGEEGDTVRFYVEGVEAKESVTWTEGDGPRPVDLTFVGVPTPTPTPTPTPLNGGGGADGAFLPTPSPTLIPTTTPTPTETPTLAPTLTPSATTPTQTPSSTIPPPTTIEQKRILVLIIGLMAVSIMGIIIYVALKLRKK